eukprot:1142438-Pelagomonas_calceolata.AAC.3
MLQKPGISQRFNELSQRKALWLSAWHDCLLWYKLKEAGRPKNSRFCALTAFETSTGYGMSRALAKQTCAIMRSGCK